MSAPDVVSLSEIDQNPTPWKSAITRDLFMLPLGSILCLAMVYWLGKTLDVPALYAKAGILLQQSSWQIAVGVAWIVIIGGTVLATVVAGHVHYEGGLFCACIGLAGLSVRMGPSRYALFGSSGPVFYACALELVLLFIPIALAWLLLRRFVHVGWLPNESTLEPNAAHEPLDQNLLAATAQVIITMLLMMILCQSDRKPQTLASVGFASYGATLITHHFLVATRPSAWFWVGPLIVGLIGYLGHSMNPTGMAIGDIEGFFAPLARPTPLDYASLGVAGSLLGYWTSQRWHQEREALEAGV